MPCHMSRRSPHFEGLAEDVQVQRSLFPPTVRIFTVASGVWQLCCNRSSTTLKTPCSDGLVSYRPTKGSTEEGGIDFFVVRGSLCCKVKAAAVVSEEYCWNIKSF